MRSPDSVALDYRNIYVADYGLRRQQRASVTEAHDADVCVVPTCSMPCQSRFAIPSSAAQWLPDASASPSPKPPFHLPPRPLRSVDGRFAMAAMTSAAGSYICDTEEDERAYGHASVARLPRFVAAPKPLACDSPFRRRLRAAADDLERRFYGETDVERQARLREAAVALQNRPATPPLHRLSADIDRVIALPDDVFEAYVTLLVGVARDRRLAADRARLADLDALGMLPVLSCDYGFAEFATLQRRFAALASPGTTLHVGSMPPKGWHFAQHTIDSVTIRKLRGKKRITYDDVVSLIFSKSRKDELRNRTAMYQAEYATRKTQHNETMLCTTLPLPDLVVAARAFLLEDRTRRGTIDFERFARLAAPAVDGVPVEDVRRLFDAHSHLCDGDDPAGDSVMDFEEFVLALLPSALTDAR
jgi:hypothetical protein